MLEIFMMKSGTSWASAVQGALAIALVTVQMVNESGEEAELELMCRDTIAAKASSECLLDMDPIDVVKCLGRPVFDVRDIFSRADISIMR
jgi:hypothetical protein